MLKYVYISEVGASAFFAFLRLRTHKREAKKERKNVKKKSAKKSESTERERKKREFELFPPALV
jgi:hypothetical protein